MQINLSVTPSIIPNKPKKCKSNNLNSYITELNQSNKYFEYK